MAMDEALEQKEIQNLTRLLDLCQSLKAGDGSALSEMEMLLEQMIAEQQGEMGGGAGQTMPEPPAQGGEVL